MPNEQTGLAVDLRYTMTCRIAGSVLAWRSSLHFGEDQSHLVILLFGEGRREVLSELVEMLADDPAVGSRGHRYGQAALERASRTCCVTRGLPGDLPISAGDPTRRASPQ